jgi:hypothetical protein
VPVNVNRETRKLIRFFGKIIYIIHIHPISSHNYTLAGPKIPDANSIVENFKIRFPKRRKE